MAMLWLCWINLFRIKLYAWRERLSTHLPTTSKIYRGFTYIGKDFSKFKPILRKQGVDLSFRPPVTMGRSSRTININRAITLSNESNREQAIGIATQVLIANSFPLKLINQKLNKILEATNYRHGNTHVIN